MRFRRTVSEGTGDPAPEDRAAELEADVREGGPRRRCGTAIADIQTLLQPATISHRGGPPNNGELVFNNEAVETGT